MTDPKAAPAAPAASKAVAPAAPAASKASADPKAAASAPVVVTSDGVAPPCVGAGRC